jgi:hypothetical protein
MTKDQYVKAILDIANEHSMSLSRLDYIDALEELADDFSTRASAATEDQERDDERAGA